MRRRLAGLALLLLAGCHNPASDLAKLDVANPAPAAGWVQYRHGPGGYAFQAPQAWTLGSQEAVARLMGDTGVDLGLLLRLVDPDAMKRGDTVSFGVMRLSFGRDEGPERLDRLKLQRLDELGEKALQGLKANAPDAKRERLDLPIGPAEHVWGTLEIARPDGTKLRLVSNMVVFATALRPFVLSYGFPAGKEADYRPTLDAMVRTVRLFHPEPDGKVEGPGLAPDAKDGLPATRSGVGAPPSPGFGTPPASPPQPEPSDPAPPPSTPNPGGSYPPPGAPDPSTPPPSSGPGDPPAAGGSGDPAPPAGTTGGAG